ncbi:MAG: PHP domain-containing protein [Candidatus Dormibacteria bacterium]
MGAAADNGGLAELLVGRAALETAGSNRERALHRAARAALVWPEEARDLTAAGRPLSELDSVGPWVATVLAELLESEAAPEAPPLRRGFLTRAQAQATVAAAPDLLSRVRSDLQMHTTWSDGKGSLEEMVAACVRRDTYTHILITDHSQGLRVANGMNEHRLRAQARAIEGVNAALQQQGANLEVLQGIEMNLSPEGEGDMDPAALRGLDVVLGAFHSKLRLTNDQTQRYLAGLRNPGVDVLAHPRGRMYNRRLGLWCDWERVLREAAELDKAVEIDAYPDRQDLDVDLLAVAREAGVRISIGTDSHHPRDLDAMVLGVAAALLAGIRPERILNLLDAPALRAWAGRHRP